MSKKIKVMLMKDLKSQVDSKPNEVKAISSQPQIFEPLHISDKESYHSMMSVNIQSAITSGPNAQSHDIKVVD